MKFRILLWFHIYWAGVPFLFSHTYDRTQGNTVPGTKNISRPVFSVPVLGCTLESLSEVKFRCQLWTWSAPYYSGFDMCPKRWWMVEERLQWMQPLSSFCPSRFDVTGCFLPGNFMNGQMLISQIFFSLYSNNVTKYLPEVDAIGVC